LLPSIFYFLDLLRVQNVTPIALDNSSGTYQKVWVLSQPAEWSFYAWVVLELYSLVLEDYRGLLTVGRWSVMAAVSAAVLESVCSLAVPPRITRQGLLMAYCYVAERAVYLSLGVFLVTSLALLGRYPITLNRNTIIHSVVFSLYFLSNMVMFLLLSAGGCALIRLATLGIQIVNLAVLGTWLATLSVAGEQRRQRQRPDTANGQEQILLAN
jgi:hypothetical protein